MQIGNFVLFDKGQREGRLITVLGATAQIMTQDGPIQWPMSDVKEAPVKVVSLADEVDVEEEMEIVQRPSPSYEEQPPIEEEDGDAESHQIDLAQEEAHPVEVRDEAREQTAQDRAEFEAQTPPQSSPQSSPQTPAAPAAPAAPQAPGAPRPGLLDDFGKKPTTPPPTAAPEPEKVLEPQDSRNIGKPTPAPKQEGEVELPKRFGKKWLESQTTEELKALKNHPKLTAARIQKLQEEIDRRGEG